MRPNLCQCLGEFPALSTDDDDDDEDDDDDDYYYYTVQVNVI